MSHGDLLEYAEKDERWFVRCKSQRLSTANEQRSDQCVYAKNTRELDIEMIHQGKRASDQASTGSRKPPLYYRKSPSSLIRC